VFGARPSAVATLVDRATRYTMVVALPDGYKADTVAAALVEHMATRYTHLRRSLTWDRGREMASHITITAALTMPVFFRDPHHPWQPPLAARHAGPSSQTVPDLAHAPLSTLHC